MKKISFLLCFSALASAEFKFPKPTIEIYKPKGFKISIPDEGFTLFAVHINVNVEMEGLEAGEIARDITKAKNGRWSFTDKTKELKNGDILYFWLYVIKSGLGYRLDDQVYTVSDSEVIDRLDSPSTTKKPTQNANCNSLTTALGKPTCSGSIILEENFDSSSSWDSGSSWSHEIYFSETSESTFVAYNKEFKNAYIKNGKLIIEPTFLEDKFNKDFITRGNFSLKGCTSVRAQRCTRKASSWSILPPVLTARLTSKNFFSFRYGRVEIKAKLPAGDWIVPELWLVPKETFYGSSSGRIKIGQALGNENIICYGKQYGTKRLVMGFDRSGIATKKYFYKLSNKPWTDSYHVFVLDWTPVDGDQIGKIEPSKENPINPNLNGGIFSPFDREFVLSLGVHVGGREDFNDTCVSQDKPKPWKNEGIKNTLNFWQSIPNWRNSWVDDKNSLAIDYIRVTSL